MLDSVDVDDAVGPDSSAVPAFKLPSERMPDSVRAVNCSPVYHLISSIICTSIST